MSNLYATISSDARSTNPTARAHYHVRATAQSWDGSLGVVAYRDRENPSKPATFALGVDACASTHSPGVVTRDYPAAVWHAAAPGIENALREAAARMVEPVTPVSCVTCSRSWAGTCPRDPDGVRNSSTCGAWTDDPSGAPCGKPCPRVRECLGGCSTVDY